MPYELTLLSSEIHYYSSAKARAELGLPQTPIVVAIPRAKTKKKVLFYSQDEYNQWESKTDLKQWDIKYKKGLAALVDDEYQDIINSPKLTLITKDDVSDKSLDIWFGKSSDLRKVELLK